MIFVIYILLLNEVAFATNYYPVGKSEDGTTYEIKSDCESKEGWDCFSITGKDLRRWKIVGGELVPDPAGAAQADIDDEATATEAAAKASKQVARSIVIEACAKTSKELMVGDTLATCVIALSDM